MVSLTGDAGLIIGVDTHLDMRFAAICDVRGRAVSRLQVPATAARYEQLLALATPAAGDGRVIWRWKRPGITGRAWLVTWPARLSRSEVDASPPLGKRRAGKSGDRRRPRSR
jgi:hypothetical protein